MENIREPMETVDVAKLHDIVPRFFRDYREKQLRLAGNIAAVSKLDGSEVTSLDVEIEESLIAQLKQAVPTIITMGEETGYERSLPYEFGLVDPIDGTSSFVRGRPYLDEYVCLRS